MVENCPKQNENHLETARGRCRRTALPKCIKPPKKKTIELGKVEGFNQSELQALGQTLGLGALKYFIAKIGPKKKMLFDPKESID